jgi:hypothetical protein
MLEVTSGWVAKLGQEWGDGALVKGCGPVADNNGQGS